MLGTYKYPLKCFTWYHTVYHRVRRIALVYSYFIYHNARNNNKLGWRCRCHQKKKCAVVGGQENAEAGKNTYTCWSGLNLCHLWQDFWGSDRTDLAPAPQTLTPLRVIVDIDGLLKKKKKKRLGLRYISGVWGDYWVYFTVVIVIMLSQAFQIYRCFFFVKF